MKANCEYKFGTSPEEVTLTGTDIVPSKGRGLHFGSGTSLITATYVFNHSFTLSGWILSEDFTAAQNVFTSTYNPGTEAELFGLTITAAADKKLQFTIGKSDTARTDTQTKTSSLALASINTWYFVGVTTKLESTAGIKSTVKLALDDSEEALTFDDHYYIKPSKDTPLLKIGNLKGFVYVVYIDIDYQAADFTHVSASTGAGTCTGCGTNTCTETASECLESQYTFDYFAKTATPADG
jgi:hypothetical protein